MSAGHGYFLVHIIRMFLSKLGVIWHIYDKTKTLGTGNFIFFGFPVFDYWKTGNGGIFKDFRS